MNDVNLEDCAGAKQGGDSSNHFILAHKYSILNGNISGKNIGCLPAQLQKFPKPEIILRIRLIKIPS